MIETKYIECDFCVVGGGLSGMMAAIAAAREGAKVVLMHERPMLGGNASSEVRMWISGAKGRDNRETGLLEEIELENMYRNPTKSYPIWDTVLYDFVRREENIRMLLNCSCMDAATESGTFAHGRTTRILSVTGWQMTTQMFWEVEAKFFCDCSGDSILAPLTGAEHRIQLCTGDRLTGKGAGTFSVGKQFFKIHRRTSSHQSRSRPLLYRSMVRSACFFASASRLSYSFLPRQSPTSTLTCEPEK